MHTNRQSYEVGQSNCSLTDVLVKDYANMFRKQAAFLSINLRELGTHVARMSPRLSLVVPTLSVPRH